ncbi:hypothetical protein UFOVP359_45 [uncultured Caudovirales phage]|uniref:Uncharacterized protein n=1 Tax=uncultured Caudovirales phage TaxID=2100421 RepID=A0A6J7WVI1_9CAUD|nr:hypothetical protein UFOVP359_45 [uncultured Caudovirales phage]
MSPNEFLMMLAATITAIGVIGVGIYKISKLVKRFIHFLDDYFGEEPRPGFDGRPGMQERLKFMEEEIACISFEMRPNHGTSIKDAVGRIEERLDKLERN